jgi:hypothetical protein
MKFVALAFAVLLIGNVPAQVVDKNIPPVAGKAKTSDKKGEQTERKQEITVNLPTSFNVTVGGKVDVVAEQKKSDTDQESSKWADPVTWFTLVLAFANVLLWLSTRRIAKEATTASGIARDAANASTTAANAALKQAMIAVNVERPFVRISDIEIVRIPLYEKGDKTIVEMYEFAYIFTNYGRTPALVTGFDRAHSIAQVAPPSPAYLYTSSNTALAYWTQADGTITKVKPSDENLTRVIKPGDTSRFACGQFSFNHEEREAIKRQNKFTWLWGKVRYDDFFNGVAEAGFIAQLYPTAGTGTIDTYPGWYSVRVIPAYTYERYYEDGVIPTSA